MPRNVKTSFNAGEFSERLYGRVELEKYANGCKTMQDFLPMPHGGATRRTGFEYIAGTKNSIDRSRLIPFQFSTIQAYIIEASDLYMRFYMNGGQIQSVDSNTKALLHCNGEDLSTAFIDDGYTGHVVTAHGNAKIDTSNSKFGGASGYFPGAAGDYVSFPNHANWDILSETNFTAECWIRLDDTAGTQYLIAQYEDGDNFWGLHLSSGNSIWFRALTGGSPIISVLYNSWSPQIGTWYHIAAIKVGNEYGIYINGQQVAYSSDSDSDTYSGGLNIGSLSSTSGMFSGRIDEVRIYHGNPHGASPNVGLSDTIIPPTQEYPYAGAGGGSGIYELATTYTESEVQQLKWVQSADVLFIVSPDRCPRKLTRTDHDDWDIADIGGLGFTGSGFDASHWPPFLDKNTTAITLTPSGTTGSITLTASDSLFNADMVGGWFALKNGYCKVTGFTSETVVDASVIVTLANTDPTTDWFESAWSDYRGWPTCLTFYEDRLCFSGTAGNPDRIDLSTTAGYENFYRAELDGGTAAADDAIAIYLSSRQVNAVRWLAGTRKLLAGTSGGEWWIDGGGADEALDATETIRRHLDSEHGSSGVAPVLIGNTVMFLQRLSRTMREFYYDWQVDQYKANDVSILAEHLTNRSNITQLAWQQFPHQILWALRSDGALLSMTYMREHEVIGWAKHNIGGTSAEVESIATIEGQYEDELWIVAKRTIDGSVERYVERLSPLVVVDTGTGGLNEWTLEDAFFVDSGLTYRGASTDTISGLDHLAGETVVALADGVVETGLTVSAGGVVTLNRPASVVHVGLNYISDLESLWPVYRDSEGLMLGYPQKITNLILMVYKSSGGLFGPNNLELDDIVYPEGVGIGAAQRVTRSGDRRIARGGDRRVVRGVPVGAEFYTGLTEDMSFGPGYDCYPTVFIRQNEPLPMTVTAIVADIE